MIKRIVDFSREIEHGTGIIDVVVEADDPRQYAEALRSLMIDSAQILFADGNTIRARYYEANQDKLQELLDFGWSFEGKDLPEKPEAGQ